MSYLIAGERQVRWRGCRWRHIKLAWFGARCLAALLLPCLLTACAVGAGAATATPTPPPSSTPASATATLPPAKTATQRPTPSATPAPSSTPSATVTASPTFTPSSTPTRYAIVRSQRRVNMRQGPGTEHPVILSLAPGAGLQVIGENAAGDWIQARLDDGREGWISASLLQLVADEAPAPESATEVSLAPEVVTNLPIFDLDSVRLTATKLLSLTRAADAATSEPGLGDLPPTATVAPLAVDRSPAAPRAGVDVFAFCDNPAYGIAAPLDLAAGSTIEIFWAWFASSDAYLRQHIANATHELRINGARVTGVDAFRSPPRRERGQHVVYWFVPHGPLDAGDYLITYRVTWRQAISDGYADYGPGTANEFEEESCRFSVR